MADSMRYNLDTNDRELILERLCEDLGIEKDRWKADVLDAPSSTLSRASTTWTTFATRSTRIRSSGSILQF